VKPTSNPDNIIEIITKSLAAIAGIASLVYILGFIIVNIHLSELGVRAFNLSRVTYISAGILFLVVLSMLFFVGAIIGPRLDDIFELNRNRNIGRLIAVIMLLITIIILLFSKRLLPGHPSEESARLAFFLLLVMMMPVTALFIKAIRQPEERFFSIAILISLFTSIIAIWSILVYPKVSPAFGGGAPVKVQLVIEDTNNSKLFTAIGIAITNSVTVPIGLLDDTGEALIVTFDNEKGVDNVAELDKSLIANILYLSRSEFEFIAVPTPKIDHTPILPELTPLLNPEIRFVTVTPTQP
jgi:hypothetical protein